jgi:methylase of polypeptide subunit release factors
VEGLTRNDRTAATLSGGGGGAGVNERAGLELLRALSALGYAFVTVTPETHRRVVARRDKTRATDLRDVFGWSLPFEEGLLPADLFATLRESGLVERSGRGWKSTVRVSTVAGRLFLHSAFPTDREDSVFLGPDSVRFADFLGRELARAGGTGGRLVDIGAGAGVGGIVAAGLVPHVSVELVDVNEKALGLARINAAFAGVEVSAYRSDGVEAVAPGFALAVANPPFIIDEDGPAYRAGGAMRGAELSLDWALGAAARLAPGGRMLLYTGSAIVDGRDALREALENALPVHGCRLSYREIDPDIFGEELDKPAYRDVERIAAVGAVIAKARP